ncbi:hypothetical protein GmHk_11G032651 [Glycine max]|nr:hypothetical protein GmHk_11G032651 [Glycine max]
MTLTLTLSVSLNSSQRNLPTVPLAFSLCDSRSCYHSDPLFLVLTHISTHFGSRSRSRNSYGEVSRSFVVRWKDELEHAWHLLDNNTELKDFYGLTTNHQVTMTRFGQSVFFIIIFKNNSKPKTYPKWHSLYHQVTNSITFKVLLSEYKVTCSSLDVPSTMYSFIKVTGFTHLNLKEITDCRIVYNHWRKIPKKLKMKGGHLHNHKICKLKLKLYLSSWMQLLTLFYFGFICN